jgi:hypothetical protein
MNRAILALACVVACLVVSACGYSTRFMPTNASPTAMKPRDPSSVTLFLTSRPTQTFVEVGILTSSHDGAFSLSNDDEVILGLREKAAEVGCDGVLLAHETENIQGQVTSSGQISTTTLKSFRATCIMFGGPPASPAAGAPPEPLPGAVGAGSTPTAGTP